MRLVRLTHIPAEVHTEVSHVLHHYRIVTGSQFTDNLQFGILQTDPGRIVRIGLANGGNVALAEVFLHLRP